MRGSVILSVIFVIVILALNSLYYVYEGEYGIIKRFDEVVDVKYEAGLGIKVPFIDSKSSLTKKLVMHDIKPTEVLTMDKKTMIVDTYAVWEIVEPRVFLKRAGSIGQIQERIEATVFNSLKMAIGTRNQVQIIELRAGTRAEEEDESLSEAILSNAVSSLRDYGVHLVDVQIKKFDLPDSNKDAVFERMISERNQTAAGILAEGEEKANMIRYETDREKEVILSVARRDAAKLEGEGESEFMSILSAAYNTPERAEFYEFLRTLDALKISMRGDKTFIMPGDSALAQTMIRGNSE